MICPVCNGTIRANAHFCAHCQAPLLLEDKYRIVRRIGIGGFGAVYQAEQLNLGGALCAVKELASDANANPQQVQQTEAQFQFEATVLAELKHPALPRVTDFFLAGKHRYLVMDFVPGETCEELLEQNGAPLPEAQLTEWTCALCDVLTYLHSRPLPVIHRDVKPSNIKRTLDGGLVLLDFGIAKQLAAGKGTAAAARAVSPPYSPLEQYGRGKGTDTRSDIYALGATMYHLATNHLPPEAPDRSQERLIPPRELNATLSQKFEVVILQAMAVKPEERFASANEMKQALTAPGSSPRRSASSTARLPASSPLPVTYTPAIAIPRTRQVSSNWIWTGALLFATITCILLISFRGVLQTIPPPLGQASATPTPTVTTATGTATATRMPATATGTASRIPISPTPPKEPIERDTKWN